MKIVDKKQLIDFLETVQLKGLDPRGKDNPTFESTVLHFSDGYVNAYGSNVGNAIFFNHTINLEMEDGGDMVLPIPDIKTWIKYIADLNGVSVDIRIENADVILAGDDGGYYEIPLGNVQSVPSYVSLPEGPRLEYDEEAGHLLYDLYMETELNPEDRYRYSFNPDKLAEATESGKNASTMTTMFTFHKSKIDIKIGAIPSVSVTRGVKYVYNDVEGVTPNRNDTWGRGRGGQQWVGVMGIHPICKALGAIKADDNVMYFRAPDKNLLFLATKDQSDEDDEEENLDTYVWMVSCVSSEEEGEGASQFISMDTDPEEDDDDDFEVED